MENNKLLNQYRKNHQQIVPKDLEGIKNIIIGTTKVDNNNTDVVQKWGTFNKTRQQEAEYYWKNRTNQPYKNILKNENYQKTINDPKDLVIHRITSKDKQGVEKELNEFKKKAEIDNIELKTEFSTTKEKEHRKKFNYNHIYKFRVPYDPKDHVELTQDKIKYYEEQQRNLELDSQKVDQVIEGLINNGIFDQNEINSIKINNSNHNHSHTKNTKSDSENNGHKDKKKEQYLQRIKQS